MAYTHDTSEGAAMSAGLIAWIVLAVLLILLLGGVFIARPLLRDSSPGPAPVATQPAGGGAPGGATPGSGGGGSSPSLAATRTPEARPSTPEPTSPAAEESGTRDSAGRGASRSDPGRWWRGPAIGSIER